MKKLKNPVVAIILSLTLILLIGVTLRFKTQGNTLFLKEKSFNGKIVLTISNIIKAGFWKIDTQKPKPEMIAKNNMELFNKESKNAKRYLDPSISPDGSIIAYTLEFNGKKSIGLMLINGLKETPFIELDDDNIEKPSFSPDFKKIAMISNNKIYIADYPGKNEIEIKGITKSEVSTKSLTWFNSKYIGYISESGFFKILNTKNTLTKQFMKANEACFSPDSKMLAISNSKQIEIYSVTIKNSSPTIHSRPNIIIPAFTEGKITWDPDSKHLLVTVKRGFGLRKYMQIAIINIKSKEKHFFPKRWKGSISHDWK